MIQRYDIFRADERNLSKRMQELQADGWTMVNMYPTRTGGSDWFLLMYRFEPEPQLQEAMRLVAEAEEAAHSEQPLVDNVEAEVPMNVIPGPLTGRRMVQAN